MQQPIVKNLRSKTKDMTSKAKAKAKAKYLTSKAKDFIKCPRGQGHGLEDFITAVLQLTQLLQIMIGNVLTRIFQLVLFET